MSRSVREVAIVGRDADAWLAALALKRAFARTAMRIRVVELTSRLTAADVYVATPSLGGLHALLGLNSGKLLAATGGAPALGQQFADWNPGQPAFTHGYDTQRVAIEDIDFLQFWVKARGEGLRANWDDFSLAAAAARQGRSALAPDGIEETIPVAAGLHLDARAYVDLIRRHALHLGVEVTPGGVETIRRDGQRIVELRLGDGASVAADLFIDASGPEAILSDPGAPFTSWRGWFGANRTLTASAPALPALPGHSRIVAFEGGWAGLFPLARRTAIVAAYDSASLGDDAVLARLPQITGAPQIADVAFGAAEPGMRTAWIGNCVALGGAAAVLERLDATDLHALHIGLTHLIALFPVDADHMPEAQGFNAGIADHLNHVRDFQLAHYALNGRSEPFWAQARGVDLPPSLAARLRLFGARGLSLLTENETFQEQNWSAVLLGHGLTPAAHDPLVDRVPADEQRGKFRALLARIAEEVRALPPADAFRRAPR